MREKFLSLNDIKKQNIGFKFFTKNNFKHFELLSVEEKWIDVAHGILGDKRQKTITVMDEEGEIFKEFNLTSETNGGNIYTIAYIEKDWDKLNFRTVESVVREKKEEYKGYLESFVKEGKMTELEMYKTLDDNSFHGIKFKNV